MAFHTCIITVSFLVIFNNYLVNFVDGRSQPYPNMYYEFEDINPSVYQENLFNRMKALENQQRNLDWAQKSLNDIDETFIPENKLIYEKDRISEPIISQDDISQSLLVNKMLPLPLNSVSTNNNDLLSNKLPNSYSNFLKERTGKRNNQYMSLCHFKICNMGRKRNSRYSH